VIYLDSFDRRILTESKTPTYRFAVSGSSEVLIPLERLESGEFDYVFRGFDIPALGSVTISYETIAIPV
jgi:hypothetical protein